MRNSLWEKKISTLLGLIFIAIGIIATSFLVKTGSNFIGKAGPSEQPLDLRITNVSDTSFTVSYKTSAEVFGSLSFGLDKNLGNSALDERDQLDGKIKPYKIHSITVRNLTPQTKYFFSILSGQNIFLNEEGPFEVTTAPSLSESPPNQLPVSGKVIRENDESLGEAIVYLTTNNSQMISTLIKDDGSYIFPLNSLRSSDLNSYMVLEKSKPLNLLFSSPGETSSVLVSSEISSIPLVVLSKNYDFTVSETPLASPSGQIGFPSLSAKESIKETKILTPKEDEAFSDDQPLFKGTASPGATLKIVINSKTPLEVEVKVDKNGNWTFRPQSPLDVGNHTVSIISKDKFGIAKTISAQFTVYAQGSQVSESATPSATPTLILTPTASPSPTPTPSPTVFISPAPTITPTPIPTLAPAGSSSIATIGAIGAVTSFIGILLFLLTRGGASL